MNASFTPHARLGARVIRADGRMRDLGIIATYPAAPAHHGYLTRLYLRLRPWLPTGLTLAAFVTAVLTGRLEPLGAAAVGLVTTAGSSYLASDFIPGSSTSPSDFRYHDCGVGTAAESIANTALTTPAGTARVVGTGSSPSAGVFQSVALISFTSSKAVTEWGLFNASSAGTMWDRRVFLPINVHDRDSIQFTYELTIPAGGS